MTLSRKRQAFIENYLRTWNATEAARNAGYTHANVQGPRLLVNVGIQEAIRRRLQEMALGADEVLARLADQARGDLGMFFKVSERWTEEPAPAEEILEERSTSDSKGQTHTTYKVRAVVLDTDKLLDPRYSRLVKRFSDSPRSGMAVELYDAQAALQLIGRNLGMFREKMEITGTNGEELVISVKVKDDGK